MKYIIPINPVSIYDVFHDDTAADRDEMHTWIQAGILEYITRTAAAYTFEHALNTFIVSPSFQPGYLYRVTCFDSIGPAYHEDYRTAADLIHNGIIRYMHDGKTVTTL